MALKLSFAQQTCVRAAGKAMQECRMIVPGARVGVAVSGGMDSFVLLKVMQLRQRIVPFRFEFMALHVNPGFDPDNHTPLADWLRAEGIAGHLEVTDHGPRAHTEENRRNSPCFYCARLRRKRLFALCGQYGLTHLAFGHNADDLVTSFLMNLVQTGEWTGHGQERTVLQWTAAGHPGPLLLMEKTGYRARRCGSGNCLCGAIPVLRRGIPDGRT